AVLGHRDDIASGVRGLLGHSSPSDCTEPSVQSVNREFTPITIGTRSLPPLATRQSAHQRAILKVQDGCDAHCTYCIIPSLRGGVWSKPIESAVAEAMRLTAAGHREIVLTGIFLGAYGQETAVRRHQIRGDGLVPLVEALCTRVPGLRRLRFSSLEPLDMTDDLIAVMRAHPRVVPHFHLPLQSGSNSILRKMNRQYRRDDFLRLVDRVCESFDRPAITTDVLVGFPEESDGDFEQTLSVVDRARFIHIHAFPFSPRPGTGAAKLPGRINGTIVRARIEELIVRASRNSFEFRKQFIGQTVELLVERQPSTPSTDNPGEGGPAVSGVAPGEGSVHHGRCERYFDVHFETDRVRPGDLVRARIDRVMPTRSHGTLKSIEERS
ncbi:MAG: MiaB/RimO family radical SAM methylthiotransferase, partial [Tepidisphaeraceae bacterium]